MQCNPDAKLREIPRQFLFAGILDPAAQQPGAQPLWDLSPEPQ